MFEKCVGDSEMPVLCQDNQGHQAMMTCRSRLTFGNLEMFASRPSCVADSRVSPNRTAAAAYCHFTVGLGRHMVDGITEKATLHQEANSALYMVRPVLVNMPCS